MDLVSRAKNICLSPASEWRVIESEAATPGGLLSGYALPMASIGAIASIIGASVFASAFGMFAYARSIPAALLGAVLAVAVSLATCFVLGLVVDALAPTFGGQKNPMQALKLVVYSYTPAWVAGILNIIPLLGILAFFAALYGIYLMYIGIPILMKSPDDKAVPYTLVVVVCAIVIGVILGMISAAIIGAALLGSAVM